MTLFSVPIYYLHGQDSLCLVLLSQICITIMIAVCIAASPAVMYDHSGKHRKATTFGIGYNFGVIIFGGFAPLMLNYLSQYGHQYIGLLMSFGGSCYFFAMYLGKQSASMSAKELA